MAVHHPGRNQGIRDLAGTVRQMVTQAVQNASFGSAGLRVYGGGWITIENGGLRVIGSAIISGLLDITGKLIGSGTLDWEGPWILKGKGTISGDTDITGNLGVKGPTKITGTLDVSGKTKITDDLEITGKTRLRGKTTLENDLEVTSGGKIKVGSSMTLDPKDSGSAQFSNGYSIYATGSEMRISGNGSGFTLGTGITNIAGTVKLSPFSLPEVSVAGLPAGVVIIGTDGTLKRTK